MNDEHKITLSIPALCAVLGKDAEGEVKILDYRLRFGIHKTKVIKGALVVGKQIILSPNDLIPTDECEKCHHKRDRHCNFVGEAYLKCLGTKEDGLCMCSSKQFKPLLRRVKTIKLTERCENCTRQNKEHERKEGQTWCLPQMKQGCKVYGGIYTPVQTVEIEVE